MMVPRWFRADRQHANTADEERLRVEVFTLTVAPTPWGPWRIAQEPEVSWIWQDFGQRLHHFVGAGPIQIRRRK